MAASVMVNKFCGVGHKIKPAEAEAFLKTVDRDKSGTIDFKVSILRIFFVG